MASGSARARRHETTRDAILAAALEIISTEGVEALSLREVARRVDYSPAGLYEYFGSKEEIIAAMISDGYRRLSLHLSQTSTDLPPYERLIELGAAYIEFARANPQHYLLMFTALPEWWIEGKVNVGSAYQTLVDTVQAGIEQGIFIPRDGLGLEEMSYTCWAIVHGMAMLQLNQLRGMQTEYSQKDRAILRILANGMTRAWQ
jgi:AcrR family transcriptional regulator